MQQQAKVSPLIPGLYLADVQPLPRGLIMGSLDSPNQSLCVCQKWGEDLHAKPAIIFTKLMLLYSDILLQTIEPNSN